MLGPRPQIQNIRWKISRLDLAGKIVKPYNEQVAVNMWRRLGSWLTGAMIGYYTNQHQHTITKRERERDWVGEGGGREMLGCWPAKHNTYHVDNRCIVNRWWAGNGDKEPDMIMIGAPGVPRRKEIVVGAQAARRRCPRWYVVTETRHGIRRRGRALPAPRPLGRHGNGPAIGGARAPVPTTAPPGHLLFRVLKVWKALQLVDES